MLVIATGRLVLILNVDDFSNVNEMRVKLLSSHPSGDVEVRCSVDKKKNVSVVKM